ncbi:hypothetical protein DEO72_LG10g4118 [Vigna unguiculata]|uniref:Uncharacterized protein n=1 Tax=Vigna unguiculata TaxID=3917 RepID=A0A4D6NHN0_VIGUN|nr:hypothetical protein DEO72_LG10g4118 [Vigna unguiculata]
MATSYDGFYPWAPLGLRHECSSFTLDQFITRYRRALCEKLGWLIVMDKDQATKLDSTQTQSATSKEEVVRLTAEVKGLHGLKKKMEERGKRVTELEQKMTELEAAFQKAEEEFT